MQGHTAEGVRPDQWTPAKLSPSKSGSQQSLNNLRRQYICICVQALHFSKVLSCTGSASQLDQRLTSWPSSATPHPKTTASIGGAVTKLGRSAHRLPTEDDCRVNDFDKLLGFLLGALLDDLEVEVSVSWTVSSVLCTISEQDPAPHKPSGKQCMRPTAVDRLLWYWGENAVRVSTRLQMTVRLSYVQGPRSTVEPGCRSIVYCFSQINGFRACT